jgi:ubiquinone/menaquinone biosynthesis C-methylase UbiE
MDVQHLPFAAATFDLAICNHVLEHVGDAAAALAELHRVLKPGGRLICQTPFATRLTGTFEDPLLQSTADRLFFYGQEDHVRLFGSDIEEVFRRAGFTGRLVPHAKILPDIDPEEHGINEDEPFFDFTKAS